MAKRLDEIVVIDVEATCWGAPPPEGKESEIIEIGVCTLEVLSGERKRRQRILVRPQRSEVSEFCNNLTGLTPQQLDDGVSFEEACSRLRREFKTRERLWASYGDYDRRQFERQCQAWEVGYPFGPTHLNVKNLFALAFRLWEEVSMPEALQRLGLPQEGRHHCGVDDAWNIAAILAALLQKLRP